MNGDAFHNLMVTTQINEAYAKGRADEAAERVHIRQDKLIEANERQADALEKLLELLVNGITLRIKV